MWFNHITLHIDTHKYIYWYQNIGVGLFGENRVESCYLFCLGISRDMLFDPLDAHSTHVFEYN